MVGLKSKVTELYMAQGQFDEARGYVDKMLAENSGISRGHLLKGMLLMRDKDIEAARESFAKSKELDPKSAESQFLYGLTFMDESEKISVSEISEALKKNPDMLKARLAMAQLYARNKDLEKSISELDYILNKQPNNQRARGFRARLLLTTGKSEAALKDARYLVDTFPKVEANSFLLARVHGAMGKFDEALSLYSELYKKHPDQIPLLSSMVDMNMMKKQSAEAIRLCDEFLATHGDNSVVSVMKVRIFLNLRQMDQAEELLLSVIKKEDKKAFPFVLLADLYRSQGKPDKASEFYEKATKVEPESVTVLMKLADLQMKMVHFSKAIQSYEKVLELSPTFLPAINNLAYLYSEQSGKIDRAFELAKQAYEMVGDNADIKDTLGYIHYKKGTYMQAEELLLSALQDRPEHPMILFHIGLVYKEQYNEKMAAETIQKAIAGGLQGDELEKAKEVLAAIEALEEKIASAGDLYAKGNVGNATALLEGILQEDVSQVKAALALATMYADQGENLSRALELAEKSYGQQQDNPQAADVLGWVYYRQSSFLLAKKYIEEALKKDQGAPIFHYHLGMVHFAEGEKEDATGSLNKAIELGLDGKKLDEANRVLQELKE